MAETTIDPELRLKPSFDLIKFIEDFVDENSSEVPKNLLSKNIESVSISDVTWLQSFIKANRSEFVQTQPNLKYFHELMEDCVMILPEPKFPPRNPELEKRIQRLRLEQAERDYKRITQNISGKQPYTEEPLSHQMREMNSHLIMILQFVISIVTAFTFGYLAPYFFYGTVAAAPRILIGIIVAFIVGIADLYFVIRFLLETEGLIKRPTVAPTAEAEPKDSSKLKSD